MIIDSGWPNPLPMRFATMTVDDIDRVIADPNIWLQNKIDGMLVTGQVWGDRVRVMGGNGEPSKSTTIAPTVAKIEGFLRTSAVFSVGDDNPVFSVVGEVVGDEWWLFDLTADPHLEPDASYSDRLAMLTDVHRVIDGWGKHPWIRLVPTARTPREKRAMWNRVVAERLEGVIARDKRKPHTPCKRGRPVNHSLKLKRQIRVDCVVTARNVDRHGKPQKGKLNAVLKVAHPTLSGRWVTVGNCSMIGKPDARVGDVVEVKAMYVGAGGKLVQPTLIRVRDDKTPEQCTFDQVDEGARIGARAPGL